MMLSTTLKVATGNPDVFATKRLGSSPLNLAVSSSVNLVSRRSCLSIASLSTVTWSAYDPDAVVATFGVLPLPSSLCHQLPQGSSRSFFISPSLPPLQDRHCTRGMWSGFWFDTHPGNPNHSLFLGGTGFAYGFGHRWVLRFPRLSPLFESFLSLLVRDSSLLLLLSSPLEGRFFGPSRLQAWSSGVSSGASSSMSVRSPTSYYGSYGGRHFVVKCVIYYIFDVILFIFWVYYKYITINIFI